ncbi:MAG TPA: hypothetical protein PLC48_05400 [Ferruginibacter sp.]|nr:hypothetical protein [Ferruginibacter sp.]
MKPTRLFIIAVIALFTINACQKELEYETIAGDATGTLKSEDSTFDCLPSTVNGIYKMDSVLGDENYVDVQVDAFTPGPYEIISDTVNGYSFKGTGTIGTQGLNTVRLYGTGKPIVPGDDTFIISFDNSVCFITVPVMDTTVEAVYTLGGSGGTCTGQVPAGTFTAGVPTADTNTVTINVEVASRGLYNISTTSVNGVSFSASGTFAAAGPQTVTLVADGGTPTVAGTFNYPVLGSTSGCAFSVIYQ